MKGKWLLASGVVILVAIAAGTLSVYRRPAEVKKQAEPPKEAPIPDEVTYMGKVRAAHIVLVPAPVDGVLDVWQIEVGQEVAEGQEIGHIKNVGLEAEQEATQNELDRARDRVSALEASILSARLEAARAESDASRATGEASRLEKAYARQQMLLKEGATPRLVFEKVEKEYQTAKEEADTALAVAKQTAERTAKYEKDIELLKKTLEDRVAAAEQATEHLRSANLIAPADGTVIAMRVEAGSEVDRGMQDLVQIAVDPAILEVMVEAEPRILERFKPGQPALITAPDLTPEGITGEVKEVQANLAIIEFVSPTPALKHGVTVTARIKLN